MQNVQEHHGISPADIPAEIRSGSEPVVLKGLVSNWPVVNITSDAALVEYLSSFYKGRPVSAFVSEAANQGRFFYNEDMTGFNFYQADSDLSAVMKELMTLGDQPNPAA